jgi:hypothetical protein
MLCCFSGHSVFAGSIGDGRVFAHRTPSAAATCRGQDRPEDRRIAPVPDRPFSEIEGDVEAQETRAEHCRGTQPGQAVGPEVLIERGPRVICPALTQGRMAVFPGLLNVEDGGAAALDVR